jgi:hypothetical protein
MIGICLLADEARLRIEVWDQAVGFPVLREAPADFESGRGLTLVDALSARAAGAGIRPHSPGPPSASGLNSATQLAFLPAQIRHLPSATPTLKQEQRT